MFGELILIFLAFSLLLEIVEILMGYLPPSRIREFPSNKFTWMQYLQDSGLGAVTPFYSCSPVPITAGLLKGGVPFGPTMAFLFSSPVLNPNIIAVLLSLFGIKVTAIYVVVTFFGSMLLAAILSKIGMEDQVKPLVSLQIGSCWGENTKSQPVPVEIQTLSGASGASGVAQPLIIFPTLQGSGGCCASNIKAAPEPLSKSSCCSIDFESNIETIGRIPFKEKIKRASMLAVDTFKGVFWYLLLGAGIAAFIYGFFSQDLVVKIAGLGTSWSIPIAAIIGVPMYIRAETITPISAALVRKGA
ncbi:MAG: permease [Candidatus Methanomethyliaceae archaeon]